MPAHEGAMTFKIFRFMEAKFRWEINTTTTIMASVGKTSKEEHTNGRHEQTILYLA
jgi:hypothetical protein